MKRVLVIAEDPALSAVLDQMLLELDCRCSHVTHARQAEHLAAAAPFDLLILKSPPDSPDLYESLFLNSGNCPVVIWGNFPAPGQPNSEDTLKDNPVPDYTGGRTIHTLPETASANDLRALLQKELGIGATLATPDGMSGNADKDCEPIPGMIGSCAAMCEVFRRIRKVAPTKSTVLIRGETGTGKELVARAIHDNSTRSKKPFIAINCAAIPETLIESELFGHEKGAFTGASSKRPGLIEEAEGGTLFLDEIGELPPEAQARLLRVIQENEIRRVGGNKSHPVNVRLIAATHRDLQNMTRSGEFRADLYYRINVFRIILPALRERASDLLGIAEHLLTLAGLRHGKEQIHLSSRAIQAIKQYDWPGNIRELENVIERAAIMADQPEISPEALEIEPLPQSASTRSSSVTSISTGTQGGARESSVADDAKQEELSLEEYFQRFVLENQEQMNETELAKKLGISRKCLWERRQRFGIPRHKSTGSSSG